MSPPADWLWEGKATFDPGSAFYRPKSKVGRDLAVLAAAVYRQQRGQLRVLDAMTGCGVRALRYQLEAGAEWVWVNEANAELNPVITANLAAGMRSRTYRITHQDANPLFFSCYQQRDFYDLIDVDSFGSPMPFVNTALWAAKLGGLLYFTSTDGRTTGGHAPDKSLQVYGAYARAHPAVHEQGLRLLIGVIVQQAAARGLQIQPIFSLFNGEIHRVMVRLVSQLDWDSDQYGFLAYCHDCGQYQTASWRQLGRVDCRCGQTPVLSGPLWLGPLHNIEMLRTMRQLALEWDWPQCASLLTLMGHEAEMPPYCYPLGEIGRRGQMDIPQRDRLLAGLRVRDFRACRTHLDAQAIKTDAPMAICLEVARKANFEAK
ncbi:tRNA (guanine-N1)-methyltransferase [Romeria aff. gracilis LEGE 07310]|uniref:tRNA (Guanine-N1)-methyltransferase n=1 Tax=Vasconcelosia minhoensis LEGE 07310 TaxID=915328 RepID=A0A8J7DP69_9CYAN|nr:tRNA (guanine-N1)-methyltransferase [Romeria gracilis]MBE9079205.1 tRNA (guanine-N1)-methyltransferase [Romeria aff. gracilis LEGE 07310]